VVSCLTAPAPRESHTLSLHDALPISAAVDEQPGMLRLQQGGIPLCQHRVALAQGNELPVIGKDRVWVVHLLRRVDVGVVGVDLRSEEHTSELQSRFDLVCRLLLEKKK